MSTYPQLQQQLANDTDAVIDAALSDGLSQLQQLLDVLIDAIPYYGATNIQQAHRSTLATLLGVNMPNNGIQPPPNEMGYMCARVYYYKGPYSGYRNAFYNGVSLSAAAVQTASRVAAVNGNLNNGWWGNYGVAVLTDAVRQQVGASLDTGKLSNDLSSYHNCFIPALSASYAAVIQYGYSPTVTALNNINALGLGQQPVDVLNQVILNGRFTADINEVLSKGGEDAIAATWFLYNLWMILLVLGSPDVDGCIRSYQQAGLEVPPDICPGNWWNGNYRSWYYALSGSDVLPQAKSLITSGMPVEQVTYFGTSPIPVRQNITWNNGYAASLVDWGTLNWYKPSPASCFGPKTMVLMADGSTRPIADIRLGDSIRSNNGPRKVVLIESPARAARPLYQLNSQQLFVTAAHPFRTAAGSSTFSVAIDPWALTEAVPSLLTKGVSTLKEQVILETEKDNTTVQTITIHDAGEQDEQVYDLILEKWEKDHPVYYVGGPDNFFAVEAETVDPLFNLPVTIAIVTAMEIVLPIYRQARPDLPSLIMQIKRDTLRNVDPSLFATEDTRIKVPGPEFYMLEDKWDSIASYTEYHLVRHLGRFFRRELYRPALSPGDHFAVLVYDVELSGDYPLPANVAADIILSLPSGKTRQVSIAAINAPSWLLYSDLLLDFGIADPLYITCHLNFGGQQQGKCLVNVSDINQPGIEYFLFNDAGTVIGRIALELCSVSSSVPASQRTRDLIPGAAALGKHSGNLLLANTFT